MQALEKKNGETGTGSGSGIRALGRYCLDLIIPPRCAGCGQALCEANLLCGDCWSGMDWIDEPFCAVSGLPFSYDVGESAEGEGRSVRADYRSNPPIYDCARSVARFDAIARRLVHQLKYYDRTDLADVMGRWMVRAGADCLDDPESWIVPVPLHVTRLWRRRFNQAGLLAQAMARHSGLEWRPYLLVRVRSTRQQVGLDEVQRRANVEGAFKLQLPDRPSLAGRSIVLVDDVWTTGATLEACCRALKRAEAGALKIVTFARVVDPNQMPI